MGKIFGNGNGKSAIEKDDRVKAFDARPPEQMAAEAMIDSFNGSHGGGFYPVVAAPEPHDPLGEDIKLIQHDIEKITSILSAMLEKTNDSKIENIKTIGRSLTYAEMIELADKVWSVIPDSMTLTRENLPAVLHLFATS